MRVCHRFDRVISTVHDELDVARTQAIHTFEGSEGRWGTRRPHGTIIEPSLGRHVVFGAHGGDKGLSDATRLLIDGERVLKAKARSGANVLLLERKKARGVNGEDALAKWRVACSHGACCLAPLFA